MGRAVDPTCVVGRQICVAAIGDHSFAWAMYAYMKVQAAMKTHSDLPFGGRVSSEMKGEAAGESGSKLEFDDPRAIDALLRPGKRRHCSQHLSRATQAGQVTRSSLS